MSRVKGHLLLNRREGGSYYLPKINYWPISKSNVMAQLATTPPPSQYNSGVFYPNTILKTEKVRKLGLISLKYYACVPLQIEELEKRMPSTNRRA